MILFGSLVQVCVRFVDEAMDGDFCRDRNTPRLSRFFARLAKASRHSSALLVEGVLYGPVLRLRRLRAWFGAGVLAVACASSAGRSGFESPTLAKPKQDTAERREVTMMFPDLRRSECLATRMDLRTSARSRISEDRC